MSETTAITLGSKVRGLHVKETRHYTGTVQNTYRAYNQVSIYTADGRTYMLLLDTCEVVGA
jgi:hypothetical protein